MTTKNTMTTMRTKNKSRSDSANARSSDAVRWLLIPAAAVICAIAINTFLIISAIVPSESMADTVKKGSLVVALRTAYLFDDPERGDIVIFRHPDIDERYIMKRVVALPGESVEIRDGRVYINGSDEPLAEEYVGEFSTESLSAVDVPDGRYYLLGDNRTESNDSRFWDDPFVDRENIYAKASLCLYPRFETLTDK